MKTAMTISDLRILGFHIRVQSASRAGEADLAKAEYQRILGEKVSMWSGSDKVHSEGD